MGKTVSNWFMSAGICIAAFSSPVFASTTSDSKVDSKQEESAKTEQQSLTLELKDKLKAIATLSGNFEQILSDKNGKVLQSSTGTFALNHPGQFRWETEEPFPQLLVCNGQTLWLWDPDLEQVTIRQLADQQDQLPVRILSGDLSVINDFFTVRALETPSKTKKGKAESKKSSNKAVKEFLLEARLKQQLHSIELRFTKDNLQSMRVLDGTGNHTQFVFSGTTKKPKPNKDFEFIPPPESDIFYDNKK